MVVLDAGDVLGVALFVSLLILLPLTSSFACGCAQEDAAERIHSLLYMISPNFCLTSLYDPTIPFAGAYYGREGNFWDQADLCVFYTQTVI